MAAALGAALSAPVFAETLRIATWHVELTRKGPGLLLRDILRGDDPGVTGILDTLTDVEADVILMTGIDWDLDGVALAALGEVLGKRGLRYPQHYAARPNSGMPSGLDLDGDGRADGPSDAHGYGRFPGNGGVALLSRLPIDRADVVEFTDLLWTDLPGALLPDWNGAPFPSPRALQAQRLSSTVHWNVPLVLPDGGRLHLLAFAAGPPVFDGPEDRNGKRNHDEIALWSRYLDGELDRSPPDVPVVVIGQANLDPADGEGLQKAIRGLLHHPRLQDPRPASARGTALSRAQGGANMRHAGDPALDTADFADDPGPGNLRTQYLLPDRALRVSAAGIAWAEGHRHALVWVDVALPAAAGQPPGTFSASQARTARK